MQRTHFHRLRATLKYGCSCRLQGGFYNRGSSSGSRWARTKTKTFLESNGQNLFRTIEEAEKIKLTAELQKNAIFWPFSFSWGNWPTREKHCQAGSTNNRLKWRKFPRACECSCLHCLHWCSSQCRPIHTQQLRPLKSSPNAQIYSRSIWIRQSTLQNVLYIESQTNDF